MENKTGMSTAPSITEMNRVIQKFMGLPTERSVPKFSGGGNRMEATIHHYHTDYNWLMSAWVKFRDLDMYVKKNVPDLFNYQFLKGALERSILNEPIEDAHKALYDAITWYNSLNKQS